MQVFSVQVLHARSEEMHKVNTLVASTKRHLNYLTHLISRSYLLICESVGLGFD
jgi:hypothetical protein